MQMISLLALTLVSGRRNRKNKQARTAITASMYRLPYEFDKMNGNICVNMYAVSQFVGVEIATAIPINAKYKEKP